MRSKLHTSATRKALEESGETHEEQEASNDQIDAELKTLIEHYGAGCIVYVDEVIREMHGSTQNTSARSQARMLKERQVQALMGMSMEEETGRAINKQHWLPIRGRDEISKRLKEVFKGEENAPHCYKRRRLKR